MSNQLVNPIVYDQYDRISDDIFFLGQNCVLKFNVSLSRAYEDKRNHFYKEFEYGSKYSDGPNTLLSIKRSYDYYLSLENNVKPDNTEKCFIKIGPSEYYLFKNGLDVVCSWFQSEEYNNLFQFIDDKLRVCEPIPEYQIRFPYSKYLKFRPLIIQKIINDLDNQPGVSVELSDPDNIVVVPIDRLMGLEYIISTFNMVLSAQTMLNFIGMPDPGKNRYTVNTTRSYKPSINGRQIPGLINKGE